MYEERIVILARSEEAGSWARRPGGKKELWLKKD
jgi:hypothetical protein